MGDGFAIKKIISNSSLLCLRILNWLCDSYCFYVMMMCIPYSVVIMCMNDILNRTFWCKKNQPITTAEIKGQYRYSSEAFHNYLLPTNYK